MITTRMTIGQRFVELLKREGVEAIFSQGDITTRDVLLHAERQGLRVVGPRHEAAGIFAAMGYYCVTGKPQAAFGAMGPGVANLLPATVAAAREHIPVIVFGARRRHGVANAVHRGAWLHSPMLPLFREVCKFAGLVNHPAEVDEVVQEAFRRALAGTPGPVYIEYDSLMHVEAWDFPPLVPPGRYRAGPQAASAAAVEGAASMLRGARSPLIIGGEAIQHARCREDFLRLCETLGCPVVTTFAGSGLLAASHPQWLLFQSRAAEEAIAAADVLLSVGTCLPEMVNYGRLGPFARNDAERRVIALDPDAESIGVNRPVDLAVVGDLRLTIGQLANAIGEPMPRAAQLPRWRQLLADEIRSNAEGIPAVAGIHPSRLMIEARKAVPDEATIVLDGGLTIFYQLAFFEKRGADFVYGANYSHLGSGLPQAIGVQLAQGSKQPVCLITGDGALGFHFMEFETAVRHALPFVVVVNDDHALGAEMAAHMQHIGHGIEVAFTPVRYDRMAQAIGGHGEYVDRIEDVAPAVERAFRSGKTSLVQVVTDPDASHLHPHPYAAARRSWIHADHEDKYGAN
jgi:thiamine pyrophosphate-dependent acetolactate synthase large subunit-like protein